MSGQKFIYDGRCGGGKAIALHICLIITKTFLKNKGHMQKIPLQKKVVIKERGNKCENAGIISAKDGYGRAN